jgi:UDPglucose 6-dehydrogenase
VNVSVVGTGYVGLVSGACLAKRDHAVICVDLDGAKVDSINAGRSPIHEDGLREILDVTVPGRLRATCDLRRAVLDTEITLIAVGTPFDGERIDLAALEQASADIGEALRDKPSYHVVVVKSTVVPGTTEEVVTPILERTSGKHAGGAFGVGMNPEFLREGQAVEDFMHPDRIVIGAGDDRVLNACSELYSAFPSAPLVLTTTRTAEMIKYASNALLATLISFSNDIANLCSTLGGVDASDVISGVKLDRRLSPVLPDGSRVRPGVLDYLDPGCGFGGSCFPKDIRALTAFAQTHDSPLRLLEQVMTVNDAQPLKMIRLVERHFATLSGLRVAVLGLAFKPETDDLRSSPAIPIVDHLLSSGAVVSVYDPVVRDEDLRKLDWSASTRSPSLAEAVRDVDVILLVTRWDEFNELPDMLAGQGRQPLVVDGRRMLQADSVTLYEGIGR